MHWFEPAYATRFLELIPGDQTAQESMDRAKAIARQLGKEPSILFKDIPGFIVNRLGYALYREAMYLLELGVADVETIDRSFRNACGVWSTIFGPFEWIDVTGGPELYGKAMKNVLPTLSNASDLPPQLQRLIAAGAHGVANGRGFYDYTESEAKRADELFHAHAWRAYSMMNEYLPLEKHQRATVD
jgi:3-hydroxybutyryl-CoA dehydrogenase